jgi:hypothetical protein
MVTLDQIRARFPSARELSDSEIATRLSEAYKLPLDDVVSELGIERSAPGVFTDIKRSSGNIMRGLGSTARDMGLERAGRFVQSAGEDMAFRNPGEINSFGDVMSRPGTTIREAVSEMVPQLGFAAASGYAGAKAGGLMGSAFGPAGTAAGAVIGGLAGGAASMFGQQYGSIRADQREQGIDDRGRAATAAVPATALEFLGPEGMILKNIARRGGLDLTETAARDIANKGAGRYGAEQVVKQGIIEGPLTEVPQTALERWGAYKDVTSPEAYDEYAVAGAKGFAGGGVIGGGIRSYQRLGLRNRLDQMDANLDNLEAPVDERLRAAGTRAEFLVNEAGRPAADQWYQGQAWQVGEDATALGLRAHQREVQDLLQRSFSQGETPQLGYTPRTMVGYPDGSVGYQDSPEDWNTQNMLRGARPNQQVRVLEDGTAVSADPALGVDTQAAERESGLMRGQGGASSAFSLTNQALPMPTDPGSARDAIDAILEQQKLGRPVLEGSREQQVLFVAQAILRNAGLEYMPQDRARGAGQPPRQASDRTQKGSDRTQIGSAPATPRAAALAAFRKAGGKPGAWGKIIDGAKDDAEIAQRILDTRINNPRTSGGQAERWVAAYEALTGGANQESSNASQSIVGQQSLGQPGNTNRAAVPAAGQQVAQPGGQAVLGNAGDGDGQAVAVQAQRQVAVREAIGKLTGRQKEYWGLRMGMGALPEDAADAEIAKQMGVSRQRVLQLKKESRARIAKALGTSVESLLGDLQTVVQEADAGRQGLSPKAQVATIGAEELSPSADSEAMQGFGVVDRPTDYKVNETPAPGMSDEERAIAAKNRADTKAADEYTAGLERGEQEFIPAEEYERREKAAKKEEERQRAAEAEEAAMEKQRQERAALERQKLIVEMLSHPEAGKAAVDWNDSKSDAAPAFEDLSLVGQTELVADYVVLVEEEAEWGRFEAMFRDFERQLGVEDVRDQKALTSGQAKPGGIGVSSQVEGPRSGEPAETRRAVEAPAKISAPQAERKAPAEKGLKPLDEITVKITAVEAETGRELVLNERADLALKENDEQRAKAQGLLECLVS